MRRREEMEITSLELCCYGYETRVLGSSGYTQMTNCSCATERYFELLKESKIQGYLFQQQNYIPKSE
jgi:hypothetical protein